MKNLYLNLLLFLFSVLSFGTSAMSGTAESAHSFYSFAVDARPVDGNFQKLDITLNEEGTYDATIHTITAGDGFPVQDTTEELGMGLECTVVKKHKKLLSLSCSRDNRPADGLLIELFVIRNEEKTYDAKIHRAAYSTLQAPELDETTEVAYGMSRQN
ncbi:MAG: hypothetical protein H7318_02230 [Oligoflexus sp.]|nr:hypothetical protein [Oligoflexus sp.]